MAASPPPQITRVFRDLSEKEIAEIESASILSRWGMSRGTSWEELLKSRRILIVSEAGAGKTYECRACRDRLWEEGEPAFVLELATLAEVDPREMLSSEEQDRFDAWLSSQSDTATFFLDSIDELKISQKSFEQALKRLNRAIGGHLGRTRIVITTRPTAIDQQLIEKHLAVPPTKEHGATAEAFVDAVMGRQEEQNSKERAPRIWRQVGLISLSREDIKLFAIRQGVENAEALLADIERRDAMDYAQRPMDLIELCADWNDHQRIRSHGDQAAANATNKLKPRVDRLEKASLSMERALEGASRLALAALLTRKLTIRYSAESDRLRSSEAALDAAKILPDWSQPERDTLLERALFNFANYGRVRFHHRSVIEYLAAKRLDALLQRQVPMAAIKRILFTDSAQGDKIIRPSARAVAAWLSIWHDGIFAEVRDRAPEVLLTEGDPQSLRPKQRAEVLTAYVERYGKGGWRGLRVPAIQVHRFASPELSATVRAIWAEGIENPEVRELVFELIGAGKLTDCADIAYGVTIDPTISYGERLDALDALVALNDRRIPAIVDSLVSNSALWPDALARPAGIRLFPKHLSVQNLAALLPRIHEPKRTFGDLRWRLPQLIAEGHLAPPDLDKLRTELTKLVSKDAEWRQDKWPHTVSKRRDLVPALIETCNRQFGNGVATDELFHSSVIGLRFSKEEADERTTRLRGFLAEGASDHREAAFWADDAFTQSLYPTTDAWDRLFHLNQYGLRLDPTKDRAWILERLANKAAPLVEREMMLHAAVLVLQPGDDPKAMIARLEPLVADAPQLHAIVDKRKQPAPANDELRQFEVDSARRKREFAERNARARASWLQFWSEVANNPDAVFNEDRADNTAWSLWQAMERSGLESRASGWNRRFIEEQFGRYVADRLRHTLKRIWRQFRPTLRSERAANDKNTFLVKWQLGLAGIYAEAEQLDWASTLTDEEARLAARYAPIELNGFPPWLDALATAHPAAVDAILGKELSLSLQEVTKDSNAAISLQNVRHATPQVAALFLPRIRGWLDAILSERLHSDPIVENLVAEAIEILLQFGSLETRKELEGIASKEVAQGLQSPFAKIWLPLLVKLNPKDGMAILQAGLNSVPVSQYGVGVAWISALFGHDRHYANIDLKHEDFSPKLLSQLVRLAYEHVRPSDDLHHEGSYTPDERDNAERGRDAILNAFLATVGPEAWVEKLKIAEDPLFAHFKDRVLAIARERASEEVDRTSLTDAQFVALDRYGEASPTTRDGMFEVMRDRLNDIDDALLEDTSPREAWALIKDERIMRRAIARELVARANHVYTVDQEAATADEKETDIRLRATQSVQQAAVELKIGEKPRSGAELRSTIKEQLIKKYLAADECRSGCLVITIASDKTWQHPDTNLALDFEGLILMLSEEADRLSNELGNSIRIMVKGYDLRPRLKTERELARMKKS